MDKPRCFATTHTEEINCQFKYDNIDMLALTIKYPIVTTPNNSCAGEKINNQISMQVDEYFEYAANTLYQQAMEDYADSLKNNFPFYGYEAYMEYTITYNDNCFLSLYTDKYEFTGGAHGNTTRTSNTWELCGGSNIYLSDFFKPSTNCTLLLTQEIIAQAEGNLKENPGIYFDNYKELIIRNLSCHNFYMAPSGITIYYQQYDIAPYSTGIVEFTIPYATIGWAPSC
ncbi:DUF3298 and DUF4163 domain-containing protein [Aminipila butyrica]|uniref:DUF3298 and DUF4163 domain-containing protein n=1 Tax=Aminipila butyrica TaxID=433296 RepID=A0A858BW31_9FIRM|nr:DUF3298 and DUF4163 domain-containing protein [Aminipila butyrica]QIB69308.1 DUF3298 and DUF4163 domain-containing protein [Aminipila butyrica]